MTNENTTSIRPLYPIDIDGRAAGEAEGASGKEDSGVALDRQDDDRKDGDEDAIEVDDQEVLGERKPRIGRRPDMPTRKEIEEHFCCTQITDRGARIVKRAGQHRRSIDAKEMMKCWVRA